jgi:heat shock protein HtpX
MQQQQRGILGRFGRREDPRARQPLPQPQANPAFGHLWIVSPLSGSSMASLFATHPPLEERVRKLRSMAVRRAA